MTIVETKEVVGFCGLTGAAGFYARLARQEFRHIALAKDPRPLPVLLVAVGLVAALVQLGLFSATRVESWRGVIPIRGLVLTPFLALTPVLVAGGIVGWCLVAVRHRERILDWLRASWPMVLALVACGAMTGAHLFAEVRNSILRTLMQAIALSAIVAAGFKARGWIRSPKAAPAVHASISTETSPVHDQPTPPWVPTGRLAVQDRQSIVLLDMEEITSVQIDRGLVFVTTAKGRFWTRYTTLAEVAPLLDDGRFQRVHRSSFVSLSSVRQIVRRSNHTARLTLSCGTEVSVSRSRMRALRGRFAL